MTGQYQLYCPKTVPLGDVVLNDVTTTADVSPGSPSNGSTFQVTNYQSTVTLPEALANVASAVSNPLTGSAVGQLDLAGATPATMSTGTLNFSVTIPMPATAGVPFEVPSSPLTLGPFTATSSAITVQQASSTSLTLEINGTPLNLDCTAFPNNTPDFDPSNGWAGTGEPTSGNIAPTIATAGGGSSSTTTVPGVETGSGGSGGSSGSSGSSGSGDVSASSSSLAFTGAGPGLGWLGVSGAVLVLFGLGLLFLVDAPRRLLGRLVHSVPVLGRFDSPRSVRSEGSGDRDRLYERVRWWLLGR